MFFIILMEIIEIIMEQYSNLLINVKILILIIVKYLFKINLT